MNADDDNGRRSDVIARLAGKGEEAIKRLADLPGGQRALEAFNDLKLQVDELFEARPRRGRAREAHREAREGGRVSRARAEARLGEARGARGVGRRTQTGVRRRVGHRSARHPQPEGLRHDLEARRCRARLLAVELDRDRRIADDRDDLPRRSSAFG